jgi:hypothetical protein
LPQYVLTDHGFCVTGDHKTASELRPHFLGLRGLLDRRADIDTISGARRQIALAIPAKQDEKKKADPTYVKTVGRNLLVLEVDLKSSNVQSR